MTKGSMLVLIGLIACIALSPSASFANSACVDLFESYCKIQDGCEPRTILQHIFDMFDRRPDQQIFAARHNAKALKELNQLKIESPSAERRADLDSDEIQSLFQAVANNPVASLKHYDRYDPDARGIGFCFGRAMTAHLEALWNFKLQNGSIRKVWAIGNLRAGNTNWRYHVTTVVKSADGHWWAIDPIFYQPLKIEAWVKRMQDQYDSDHTMAVFHTEAKQFGPAIGSYKKRQLNEPFYNDFFIDLLDEFSRERLFKD